MASSTETSTSSSNEALYTTVKAGIGVAVTIIGRITCSWNDTKRSRYRKLANATGTRPGTPIQQRMENCPPPWKLVVKLSIREDRGAAEFQSARGPPPVLFWHHPSHHFMFYSVQQKIRLDSQTGQGAGRLNATNTSACSPSSICGVTDLDFGWVYLLYQCCLFTPEL